MSQSAECGATVVPQWYASLPEHGVLQGSIFKRHVVVAWKVLQQQCAFGNQGLSLHPEEAKKVRFWNS